MATCKLLLNQTRQLLLRNQTIGITSFPGHDVSECGLCIDLLQSARKLHIRCLEKRDADMFAKILQGHVNIENLTVRTPQMWLNSLKVLKVSGKLTFERWYRHHYSPCFPPLDVIAQDWGAKDEARILDFKTITTRSNLPSMGTVLEDDNEDKKAWKRQLPVTSISSWIGA